MPPGVPPEFPPGPTPPELPPGQPPEPPSHPIPPGLPPENPPEPPTSPIPPSGKGRKETLLVKVNITKLDYTETDLDAMRESVLKVPDDFSPQFPSDLKNEIKLKKHQIAGLAWMQYLYSKAPEYCR